MKRTKNFLLAALLLTSSLGLSQQTAARQLVERQARAWEKQDFTLAASDWLPTAVLMSPEGNTPAPQMAASMKDYFKDFSDLHVTDPTTAIAFYEKAFGWQTDDLGFATLLRRPGYGDHLEAISAVRVHCVSS